MAPIKVGRRVMLKYPIAEARTNCGSLAPTSSGATPDGDEARRKNDVLPRLPTSFKAASDACRRAFASETRALHSSTHLGDDSLQKVQP